MAKEPIVAKLEPAQARHVEQVAAKEASGNFSEALRKIVAEHQAREAFREVQPLAERISRCFGSDVEKTTGMLAHYYCADEAAGKPNYTWIAQTLADGCQRVENSPRLLDDAFRQAQEGDPFGKAVAERQNLLRARNPTRSEAELYTEALALTAADDKESARRWAAKFGV